MMGRWEIRRTDLQEQGKMDSSYRNTGPSGRRQSTRLHPLHVLFPLILVCYISCSDLGHSPDEIDWQIGSPEDVQLDGSVLTDLTSRIRSGSYGEIHSLLVVRHDKIVWEEYFRGSDRDALHPLYSVTKSFASTLLGIAVDQGKIGSLRQTVLSLFPEYTDLRNVDAYKRAMTLEDVLTMRSGIQWDEFSTPYGDPRNPTSQLSASSDWMRFILDQPMSDPPGTRFRYNSGCTMLLSGIIRNSTHLQAEEFAREHLFAPLNIFEYQWERGAQGVSNTGWGLRLRPRDMAKLGRLFLHKGKWGGKQIVSNAWIENSTSSHVTLSGSFGYGFQWWMLPLEGFTSHAPRQDDIKIAWGWGDQFIFVIPLLDMVVVSTAGNYSGPLQDQAITFVRDYVVRSVQDVR